MKKHEKIAKREASGFKYYTKKDLCGKPGNQDMITASKLPFDYCIETSFRHKQKLGKNYRYWYMNIPTFMVCTVQRK